VADRNPSGELISGPRYERRISLGVLPTEPRRSALAIAARCYGNSGSSRKVGDMLPADTGRRMRPFPNYSEGGRHVSPCDPSRRQQVRAGGVYRFQASRVALRTITSSEKNPSRPLSLSISLYRATGFQEEIVILCCLIRPTAHLWERLQIRWLKPSGRGGLQGCEMLRIPHRLIGSQEAHSVSIK
jgi:hypothetical protein